MQTLHFAKATALQLFKQIFAKCNSLLMCFICSNLQAIDIRKTFEVI